MKLFNYQGLTDSEK